MSQRQVLESQSAVSAREDDQDPNNVDDPSDHWFSIAGPARVAEPRRVGAIEFWRTTGWDGGNKHLLSVKDLRDVIEEFHNVDQRSFAFRYPITIKAEASLQEGFRFNVFHVADVLNALFRTLLGAASVARIEYDDAVHALGEAQKEARQNENLEAPDFDPGDYEPYD